MSEGFTSHVPTWEERSFGRNILYMLTERREALEDLAKGIGVSYGTVYAWAANQLLPSDSDWPKLCDYLHVAKDDLLNRRLPVQKRRQKAA